MRRGPAGMLSVLFLVTTVLVSPARASCAPPPPMKRAMAEAPAVFVGQVVSTTNEDRWAVVDVEEVWKGDVPERVEVRGGPADPPGRLSVVSSVDRDFKNGRRYLFVPYRRKGDVFLDNICTRTTRYSGRLDKYRPAGAVPLPPDDAEPSGEQAPVSGGGVSPWLIVGLGAAACAGGAILLSGRRRRASTS